MAQYDGLGCSQIEFLGFNLITDGWTLGTCDMWIRKFNESILKRNFIFYRSFSLLTAKSILQYTIGNFRQGTGTVMRRKQNFFSMPDFDSIFDFSTVICFQRQVTGSFHSYLYILLSSFSRLFNNASPDFQKW